MASRPHTSSFIRQLLQETAALARSEDLSIRLSAVVLFASAERLTSSRHIANKSDIFHCSIHTISIAICYFRTLSSPVLPRCCPGVAPMLPRCCPFFPLSCPFTARLPPFTTYGNGDIHVAHPPTSTLLSASLSSADASARNIILRILEATRLCYLLADCHARYSCYKQPIRRPRSDHQNAVRCRHA